MAITTLDGIVAGAQVPRFFIKAVPVANTVAGRPQTTWDRAGVPGAGSYDTTLAGVALSSSSTMVNGQIPHTDPGSGNAYLARFGAYSTSTGTIFLADRLWHNGGFTITSTSAQTVNSATFPARDANGSTNGEGVLLGLEVSAATGSGTPTITISYTNQDGTSGRTGTNSFATTATASAGAFYPIGLQAGDRGVRSVQSLTLSATWTSGTINLVAYRPLAFVDASLAGTTGAIDPVTGGLPRLYDGVVPYIYYIPTSTTPPAIGGLYVETQG